MKMQCSNPDCRKMKVEHEGDGSAFRLAGIVQINCRTCGHPLEQVDEFYPEANDDAC